MAINPYEDILVKSICGDIKKARDNGAFAGSVILTLSAIDAMAFLAMPKTQKEVHLTDYVDWTDKYIQTDSNQPYQYKGIDLYGARCGIVHRYGAISRLSEQGKCKIFVYHNGPEHIYKPRVNKEMVLISILRFTNDFFNAVRKFMQEMRKDSDLKSRVDSRILQLFRVSKADE
jgi:hypothetical protein